tara:strand:- start:220 stop:1035 length:816 start_codon:yes stop_codon:yes gene_type:complete
MTESKLITPAEFLVVKHSFLDGNINHGQDTLKKTIDDLLSLEPVVQRKVIPCFEGDLLTIKETGEIILTHQNFSLPSQAKYQELSELGIATSLRAVLDKIQSYQQSNNQRMVLCFELKKPTSVVAIRETINLLTEYGLAPQDVYFDSFFGDKLNLVKEINQELGTNYNFCSLHLIGNASTTQCMVTRPKEYDVLTIPIKLSFGKLDEPVIYGAVGDEKTLSLIATDPSVQGAYYRPREGSGLSGLIKMGLNSISNTVKLRKTHLLSVSGSF